MQLRRQGRAVLEHTLIRALALCVGASTGPALGAAAVDATFGANGHVVLELAGASTQANATILQRDQKIVVVGTSPAFDRQSTGTSPAPNRNFLVVRYNADGTLDTTFDGDGVAQIDFAGGDDRAAAVVQQSDDKLVVAGSAMVSPTGDYDFAVVRLNADGSLDTSFNGTGKATMNFAYRAGFTSAATNYPRAQDHATALMLQTDGRLIVGGTFGSGRPPVSEPGQPPAFDEWGVTWVRLMPDGTLDATYADDGQVDLDDDLFSQEMRFMALRPDGRLVVAYETLGSRSSNMKLSTLFLFDTAGSLEQLTHLVGPVAEHDTTGARSVVLQADGKLVVAGALTYETEPPQGPWPVDSFLTRLHADMAAVDGSFGSSGWSIGSHGDFDDAAQGLVIEPGQKLVALGFAARSAEPDSAQDASLVRFEQDGNVDGTFAPQSRLLIDFSEGGTSYSFVPAALLRTAAGQLLLVGNRGILQTALRDSVIVRGTLTADSQRLTIVRVTSTPQFGFETNATTAEEDQATVVLTVARTGVTTGPVSISYATVEGTARTVADFASAAGTLTWQPGDADAKTIAIVLSNDQSFEPNEQFSVTLANPSEGSLGESTSAVTIIDDDPRPPVDRGGGGSFGVLILLAVPALFRALHSRRRLRVQDKDSEGNAVDGTSHRFGLDRQCLDRHDDHQPARECSIAGL